LPNQDVPMRRLLTSAAALLCLILGAQAFADEAFPLPYGLEPQVRFWKRIYSEVDSGGGLIHDSRYLDVIYARIEFPDGATQRQQQDLIDATREHYRQILLALAARASDDGLDPEAQRVLRLWPTGVTPETLRDAAENIRFQLGQADRFREGLIRSGAWHEEIVRTLRAHGVPEELASLPHVESSYNPQAYSHAGAAGLWQLMPRTGRRYLRVDRVVDERFDPFKASAAAAAYLAEGYQRTGSWPLAVTGYNSGTGGMVRAVEALGTSDVGTVLRHWDGPGFGFASRNFYTEFLAAHEIASEPERYFGRLDRDPPFEHTELVLRHRYSVRTLQRALGLDLETLRMANLALRQPFWRGRTPAPAGYVLRIPGSHLPAETVAKRLARLPEAPAPAAPRIASHRDHGRATTRLAQAASTVRWIRVRRGDTLSGLAQRHGVSMRALMATNGLRDAHKIRPGQRLKLPSPTSARREPAAISRPAVRWVRVRRGETLSLLARRHGVSVRELMAANGLRDADSVRSGQRLRLPAGVRGQHPLAEAREGSPRHGRPSAQDEGTG
jgi:membrane-bound lytic murein transglycosylase D